MTIALDYANWFAAVAKIVNSAHLEVAGQRPADNDPSFPAWQKKAVQLTDIYSALAGAAMQLRNSDAHAVMTQIAPQLTAIQDQTKKAQAVITKIADWNSAMKLIAAFGAVAVSIGAVVADPVAGAAGLVKSGSALATALKPYVDGKK